MHFYFYSSISAIRKVSVLFKTLMRCGLNERFVNLGPFTWGIFQDNNNIPLSTKISLKFRKMNGINAFVLVSLGLCIDTIAIYIWWHFSVVLNFHCSFIIVRYKMDIYFTEKKLRNRRHVQNIIVPFHGSTGYFSQLIEIKVDLNVYIFVSLKRSTTRVPSPPGVKINYYY